MAVGPEELSAPGTLHLAQNRWGPFHRRGLTLAGYRCLASNSFFIHFSLNF